MQRISFIFIAVFLVLIGVAQASPNQYEYKYETSAAYATSTWSSTDQNSCIQSWSGISASRWSFSDSTGPDYAGEALSVFVQTVNVCTGQILVNKYGSAEPDKLSFSREKVRAVGTVPMFDYQNWVSSPAVTVNLQWKPEDGSHKYDRGEEWLFDSFSQSDTSRSQEQLSSVRGKFSDGSDLTTGKESSWGGSSHRTFIYQELKSKK